MAGDRLSKVAIAGCSILLFAAVLIAQDAPGRLPTTTRQAEPTTQARQAATRAGQATTRPTLVSNVFVDTDLRQALQDVASQVGVSIIPEVSVSGVVSCELKDVPLDKALEILLAGSGYVVKKQDDYYLVCSSDPKSPLFSSISITRIIRLSYVKSSATMKLISAGLRNYCQADDETNTLVVTAPQAILERIMADIRLFDLPPRHVMLDAKVIVMEQDDLLDLGIQWGWPQVKAGFFTNSDFHGGGLPGPDWPWGVQVGYTTGKEFSNSLLLTLSLLTQNENAVVLASPQLMAQDGKEAQIAVNTEEYFEITSQGAYAQSTLQKVESGTVLKVIPRIGENGDITLDISTEVSDVVGRGEKTLPVITRRTAKSTVRVQNGGTAAIAGLMQTRARLARNGVSGAAEMPVLGPLFRKDTNSKSSRQVAIFVTARLMGDGAGATSKPAQMRLKLVGDEFRQQLGESLRRLDKGGNE